MNDDREASGAFRATLASLVSLSLILAPWPAWGQAARVAAPAAAASSASAAAAVAPIGGSLGALSALRVAPALDAAPLAAAAPILNAPISAAAAAAPSAAPEAAAAPSASASPAFATEASVRGKTVVMIGTKSSRPFIMTEAARVARELGLTLVVVDEPDNRANSAGIVPDGHFIAAPISARDEAALNAVAEAVAAHPIGAKADVVTSFMSLYAQVTARVTERLGASGIPAAAVAAANDKPAARRLLNADPSLAVPFRELTSAEQARAAYREVSGGGRYKVVIKTIRGENSRFLALGLDSEDEAAKAYAQMDADVKAFVERPEARQTTFSSHPGIMMERMIEKLPGTEETSVEVVMQHGKPAFAIVSDTLGIGHNKELAGGILVFPSQQPEAALEEIIEASGRALKALGIENGSARPDMMTTKDGPRVIEVNPLMGSVAIWEVVRSLTGVSLVEQGLRALLNLRVDPGHAPDGVAHYIFLASGVGGSVEAVEGLDEARRSDGVVNARSFVAPGDTISAAGKNTYEEWAELIGKGKSWREAIANAIAGARRMVLRVRIEGGAAARQTGDYLQPTAAELTAPAAAPAVAPVAAPGLTSKLVLGFLSTFALVSVVVESTSLAISQMTQPLAHGFMALAGLTSISYAAYTLGSFLGGKIIKKFGVRLAYRSVLALRAGIWATMAFFFDPAAGTIALAIMIPLFSLDYFFHAIGRVAEHSLQVAWFRDSEASSSRFGSRRDFIEYGSVFAGSAMALVVAAFGFGAVIYPASICFGVAALLALALKLPTAASDGKPGRWSDGFKTVLKNPNIYKPLTGYILVNSFLYMMYYIVATAFGAYAAPNPEHAAAVAGALTAVYGAGAWIGSIVMDRLGARIDQKAQALPEGERKKGERGLYARSAAKTMPWAAAALLGSWLFLFPLQIGTVIWPIFPVSIALLAIGFTAQMALNYLDVILKSNIPKAEKDMAVGAIRTLIYSTIAVGCLAWGSLFALFGPHAFILFAAFNTAVAAWLVSSMRGIKAAATATPPQ